MVFRGKADDEGDMGALLPAGVLSTRHADAVVGPDDDDGVVPEPVFLQVRDDLPGAVVDLGDRVVVARPGFAKERVVRMVGGMGALAGS